MPPAPPESHVPVHNNTKMTIFVASTMIPAGETRILPAHQVPAHLHPARREKPEPKPDPVLALLDKPVREIVPELKALNDRALAELKTAEKAGKTRSSLMAAIAEEELRRAALKADALHAQEDVAEVIASLPGLTDLELDELYTTETAAGADEGSPDRTAVIEAIDAEFARRVEAQQAAGAQD